MTNPTKMLLVERTVDRELFIEFFNPKTRDAVRFQVGLPGAKMIVEKLSKWINEQEQSDRQEKDPDDC